MQCSKPLAGRSDKKFCDAYCRNTYNNKNKAQEEVYIQEVNTRIRKNRRILKTLCPEGKATVRKEILETMNYDFNFFSGLFKSKLLYYLVYDYAFSPITDHNGIEKALIVKRQSYMQEIGFDLWQ